MKIYTILARSLDNSRIRRMGEIRCNNAGEARQYAMQNIWQELDNNEQMIVASPKQMEYWRKKGA